MVKVPSRRRTEATQMRCRTETGAAIPSPYLVSTRNVRGFCLLFSVDLATGHPSGRTTHHHKHRSALRVERRILLAVLWFLGVRVNY